MDVKKGVKMYYSIWKLLGFSLLWLVWLVFPVDDLIGGLLGGLTGPLAVVISPLLAWGDEVLSLSWLSYQWGKWGWIGHRRLMLVAGAVLLAVFLAAAFYLYN